eukprot:snap_masked-scaffold_24-processed-gene-2.34-mRNA-1 protein AED:0.02 eAED:0.02 QI:0/-1/0/1/-1/1/1/0/767
MKLDIDGMPVYFPYEKTYPEQLEYMTYLKSSLDSKGHCMLEMPTGTGKTISLLSLICSYQKANPSAGKLIYCTRTVPEMKHTINELKRVVKYIGSFENDEEMKFDGETRKARNILGICLSARRNMCLHKKVIKESDRERVDALCRRMTAPWVRQKYESEINIEEATDKNRLCNFYEGLNRSSMVKKPEKGIFDLDDIKKYGKENNVCPYFLVREIIQEADVIVFNYQYLLDPKISKIIVKEINRESIIVFDEAHNIDNVCIEALSVHFKEKTLNTASGKINSLQKIIDESKGTTKERLVEEYNKLVEGLEIQSSENIDRRILSIDPVLDLDEQTLNTMVSGNLRKAEHFLKFLDIITKYLKSKLNVEQIIKETPLNFLHQLQTQLGIDPSTLRMASYRLNSLLQTLEIVDLDEYNSVTYVADFLTLVGIGLTEKKYRDGFMLIIEPFDERTPNFFDPVLQLACLDASLAIAPILERFRSVVITSGTLSPIDLYPTILDFNAQVKKSLSMSLLSVEQIGRNGKKEKKEFVPICPLIVTKGGDQTQLTSQYSARGDHAVMNNYGSLLIELSKCVPDGMVCFFPSYQYMETTVAQWHKDGVLQKVLRNKLIFLETKDVIQTTLALDNFRRACDCGRGAVFLSIARGKVSEGIDFDRHYGRCVLLIGIPFQYTRSHVLLSRLEYLSKTFGIREDEFLAFDALRQSAQCVGRVVRNKLDYGIMIFADKRYASNNKRTKLPPWITQFLEEESLDLSVDEAVLKCKKFLRDIVQ